MLTESQIDSKFFKNCVQKKNFILEEELNFIIKREVQKINQLKQEEIKKIQEEFIIEKNRANELEKV